MANAEYLELSNSESPRYIGRVGAALLGDDDILNLNGQVCVAADIGRRFGIQDVDGKIPRPLTLEEA